MAKNSQVIVRVSDKEYERLKSKADYLGMKVSTYLRFIGLNAKIEVNTK